MTLISIVTPYHEKHAAVVRQAVASCLYQTVSDFEVIVVNDSSLPDYVFQDNRVRCVSSHGVKLGKNRAAVARNIGLQHARGEYVVYLDADDYLLPRALEILLRAHVNHNKTYTYSSHYNGQYHMRPPDYNQETYKHFNIHPITCLIPRQAVLSVGGFDEDAPGWEDWTLYLRLAIHGYCGEYHRGPIFVYRDEYSINHVVDVAGGNKLMEQVLLPYKRNGEIQMAACCGGTDRTGALRTVSALPQVETLSDGYVLLEYVGDMQGTAMWRHPVSGRVYRAGRNAANRYLRAPAEDVAWLEQFKFRRAMPEQPLIEPPPAAPVVEIVDDEPVTQTYGGMEIIDIITVAETEAPKAKRGRPKSS